MTSFHFRFKACVCNLDTPILSCSVISAKIRLSLSMFRSHSIFVVHDPRFDIRVSQCDIDLATLEFHNATLKFDNNTTLVFHEIIQLRIFNFTPTIRHAQLPFYARLSFYACFTF